MNHRAWFFALALAGTSFGQISYTTSGSTYTQNFNALAQPTAPATTTTGFLWTNNSTLAGWHLFRQPAGAPVAIANYGASIGDSNTGSFYSFGSAASTDRALGSIAGNTAYWGNPGNGAPAGWIAVDFTNNTGAAVKRINAHYDGEQWRNANNGQPQTLVFEYGFGASFDAVAAWSLGGAAFNFTNPFDNSAPSAIDGNLAANRSANRGGAIDLNWAAGSTLWVRWRDTQDNGNDHGLSIDNFSISGINAVPEPGAFALAGMAGAAAWMVRRRRVHAASAG